MAQTPATTTKKTPAKKKRDVAMFVKTSEQDDDGNYTADIFGETFTLSSDVNGWLTMLAGSGDLRAVRDLVESVIVVPEPDEDETLEQARRKEKDRFHGLMSKQQHFSIEDAMTFVSELIEASGNDQPE